MATLKLDDLKANMTAIDKCNYGTTVRVLVTFSVVITQYFVANDTHCQSNSSSHDYTLDLTTSTTLISGSNTQEKYMLNAQTAACAMEEAILDQSRAVYFRILFLSFKYK